MAIDPYQEFLVQPVDASWLQCNIECQEACPVGTNCRGYLNLAAEGRFEEGYILSREPNPVAAMCSYVCSAPCERACRRGDIETLDAQTLGGTHRERRRQNRGRGSQDRQRQEGRR